MEIGSVYIFAQVLNPNAIIKRIIAKACVDVVVVLSVLLFPKRTTLAEHPVDIVINRIRARKYIQGIYPQRSLTY